MNPKSETSAEIVARVEAAVAALQAKYPQLGITHGYIGNVGFIGRTYCDDRSWRLFTKVRVFPDDANSAQVYIEGYDFDVANADEHLGKIVARIRCAQAGYELRSQRHESAEGVVTWSYGLRPLNSTETHGSFETVNEAANAAVESQRLLMAPDCVPGTVTPFGTERSVADFRARAKWERDRAQFLLDNIEPARHFAPNHLRMARVFEAAAGQEEIDALASHELANDESPSL